MMKKLIRKHYIFILIFALLGVCICIKLYPEWFGDLIKFPFDAGVWGTFSDFTMVIVTAVTLYFLVHNLKIQRTTLELQRIALEEQRGEKEINKLQVRPDIEITKISHIGDSRSVPNSPLINRNFQITLAIKDAGMRDCKPIEVKKTKHHITPQLQHDIAKNYSIGHELKLSITFIDIDPRPQYHLSPEEFILDFRFTDTLGNKYSKMVTLKSNGDKHLEPPIAIPSN